jgi:hypothetical protein
VHVRVGQQPRFMIRPIRPIRRGEVGLEGCMLILLD